MAKITALLRGDLQIKPRGQQFTETKLFENRFQALRCALLLPCPILTAHPPSLKLAAGIEPATFCLQGSCSAD